MDNSSSQAPFLIGVAGGTASGKVTFKPTLINYDEGFSVHVCHIRL